MPSIGTYRKQAKLLIRWHRERNYSIGEKLRLLERQWILRNTLPRSGTSVLPADALCVN